LTVEYVCQKCSKSYSQNDFEASNYCGDCGGFLLKKYVVTAMQVASETSAEGNAKKIGDLVRVAENLRRRSEVAKEYDILQEPAELKHPQGVGSDSWILGCELDDALRLKTDLMQKFEGKSLAEAIHGETISNDHGECYCIRQNHRVPFKRATAEDCRLRLLLDLKLLPGIGPAPLSSTSPRGRATRLSCPSIPEQGICLPWHP
jgi:DNA-directed RNA polymerase subunit RPC12/RpoP